MELGKYRNLMEGLPNLDVEEYERIFKVFKSSKDNKEFYFYSILDRVDFPDFDSQYLDYYTNNSKIPMTTLSYKIYGDIKSWWILYLMNRDKFDGPPFYAPSGDYKFLSPSVVIAIYNDITDSTIFSGRHF